MFVSLDLETTGFDPTKDKIIEFGAVKFDDSGKEIGRLTFLANPGFTLPQIITHITKIKDEDLKDKPPFENRIDEVKEFIGDIPIIGHNIAFDTGFLRANNLEITNPEFDTHEMASILITGLPSYSLEILSKIFKLQHAEKHRALDDSIAAMELFLKLLKEFQNLSPELLETIKTLSQKSNWPLKQLLQNIESSGEPRIIQTENPFRKELSNFKQITEIEGSGLFEIAPPYQNLILDLIENCTEDTYIAIPNQLFFELQKDIPEDVNKIDTPENYLSPKRLKEFSEKEFYENHEITALIKYLIWEKETKTGLLSEIALKGKEKQTLKYINIDKSVLTAEEPYFKKNQAKTEKPVICTHQYLIDFQPKNRTLILFDFERFQKSLIYKNSAYLTLEYVLNTLQPLKELDPENPTIENLIIKSTIFFGILGIIFDRSNDENIFVPRSVISAEIINSQEWTNARDCVKNLIEISKELGEIKNQNILGYLNSWKEILQTLHRIFFDPEILNKQTWIENVQEQLILKQSAPVNLIEEKAKEIFQNFEEYKIVNEVIKLEDDGKFFRANYGFSPDLPIHSTPTKATIVSYLINDIKNDDRHVLTNFFIKYLENNNKKIAILFNSKKELEFFTLKLSQENIPVISQLTGSLGKLKELHKNDSENAVTLLTPGSWNNLDEHQNFDQVFIHKIPFEPPSDPQLILQSEKYKNPFIELQIPRAIISLKKVINRLSKNPEKPREVVILDSRICQMDYGQEIIKNLKALGEVVECKLEKICTF